MGTFGTGPFDSDSALDFLDDLRSRTPQERVDLVVRTLEAGFGPSAVDVLPEDVIASAAVVAANLVDAQAFPWGDAVKSLSFPVSVELVPLVIRALDAMLPEDGWWWRSWVDDAERSSVCGMLAQIRFVLGHADFLH